MKDSKPFDKIVTEKVNMVYKIYHREYLKVNNGLIFVFLIHICIFLVEI